MDHLENWPLAASPADDDGGVLSAGGPLQRAGEHLPTSAAVTLWA